MTTYITKSIHNNMQDTQIKIVELKGITKKYPFVKILNADTNSNFEKFYALKEVSLDVKQGEVLGVIGRNGAGKTTLLNIIAGTLSPTEGEIFLKGRLMGLFNLGVGFQDELSGKENIFLNGTLLGAKTKEIESKLSSIIEFSELDDFIKMPLGSYSQGMRLRLGFSIVANLDFDILVIDEILAVGDTVFQNKCFERLMDFRRSRKTLIITNQNMDLIERLCDKVVLLDHGHLLFYGNTLEGINKYRALLNTEKFFVGPKQKNISLVETTKKWADDISCWYKKLGTKEAIIESVEFINKFGYRCNRIRSRDSLRIKVNLTLRDKIKDPHFGIAIFREDGVYCYGPNTAFDGYRIPSLDKCRGHFTLNYQRLLLAPGEYRVSVAIWDRNETLAFDYHNGYYKLIVGGYHNSQTELVKIDFKIKTQNWIDKLAFFKKRNKCIPNLSLLKDKWGQKLESKNIRIESVKFLNSEGQEKNIFMTNNFLKLSIKFLELCLCNKDSYLWLGIYRDDGIYCQGIIIPLNRNKEFQIIFPKLPLLPGSYKISIGVWDELEKHFLMHHHGIYCFRTVYNRQDHGTVCLEHSWKWKLSKIK